MMDKNQLDLTEEDFNKIIDNIKNNMARDFISLRDWIADWTNNIKDMYVFMGLVPYLTMFINGANEIFQRFKAKVNNELLYKQMPKIAKIRSHCIKLYNYEEDEFNKIICNLKKWLTETNIKLQNYYNSANVNNYELYYYNDKIVNTFHMFNRQCDADTGIYTNINPDFEEVIFDIIYNIEYYAKILNQNIGNNFCDMKTFSFNKIIDTKPVEMIINENIGSKIVFLDLLSVINFYNEVLKNSILSKEVLFKIKYIILTQVVISLKVFTKYEKNKLGYKTLYDNEIIILQEIEKKYVINSLINLCKHYYNDYIDYNLFFIYKKANYFKKFFEHYLNKSFANINIEIDNAILEISEILNSHIFFKDIVN